VVEGGEVEEAGDSRGGADELAGPVDDRVEVLSWGEAGLNGFGELAEAVGGAGIEGEVIGDRG
jgi:hypothetical protein